MSNPVTSLMQNRSNLPSIETPRVNVVSVLVFLAPVLLGGLATWATFNFAPLVVAFPFRSAQDGGTGRRDASRPQRQTSGGLRAAGVVARAGAAPHRLPGPARHRADTRLSGLGPQAWDGSGAGDENRTRVASLEDWGSTIELRPRTS